MLMCSLSVAFTVLVLNYHHRTPDTHEMPNWVSNIEIFGNEMYVSGWQNTGVAFRSDLELETPFSLTTCKMMAVICVCCL